jgi:four helix bundle protein
MRPFRSLRAWREAHELTLALYGATGSFPRHEQYGLTAQIRRSAASVCANLAEGCGRRTDADFGRFVQIALGSASELEYHMLLAADLKLLTADQHSALNTSVTNVKRMLTGLARKLRTDGG